MRAPLDQLEALLEESATLPAQLPEVDVIKVGVITQTVCSRGVICSYQRVDVIMVGSAK